MKLEHKLESIAIFMGCKNIAGKGKYPLYQIPEHAYEVNEEEGGTITVDTFEIFFNDMQYNRSWDWLMPVVSKILFGSYTLEGVKKMKDVQNTLITCSIEKTFEAVCNFIEWNSSNK